MKKAILLLLVLSVCCIADNDGASEIPFAVDFDATSEVKSEPALKPVSEVKSEESQEPKAEEKDSFKKSRKSLKRSPPCTEKGRTSEHC